MEFKKEDIISFLKAKPTGKKGWYLSQDNCPYCGKEKHLAFIFGNISSFVCKKCESKGTLYELLKKLHKEKEFITGFKTYSYNDKLPQLITVVEENEEENIKMPIKSLPIGFNRIYSDNYLNERGFVIQNYLNLEIGITKIDPIVKDYIIFVCRDEEKNVVGWVARSKKSKEELEKINNERKLKGINSKILRWRNSENTEFSLYLLGQNEIKEGKTKTIIIVEGITSKANIDKVLNLFTNDEIKCCCSFGKKMSFEQMNILRKKRIENIILLYDSDAIKVVKELSFELSSYFNVNIGFIDIKKNEKEYKDPGDINKLELEQILSNLQSPIQYYLNKI